MGDRVIDRSRETWNGLAHFIHPPLTIIDDHQRRWNHLAARPTTSGG